MNFTFAKIMAKEREKLLTAYELLYRDHDRAIREAIETTKQRNEARNWARIFYRRVERMTAELKAARGNVAELASREAAMRRALRSHGIDPNIILREDVVYLEARAKRKAAHDHA